MREKRRCRDGMGVCPNDGLSREPGRGLSAGLASFKFFVNNHRRPSAVDARQCSPLPCTSNARNSPGAAPASTDGKKKG